jgi:hypothetical protein
MDLDYYLFCRKSYGKILQELKEIINIFEDIDNYKIEDATRQNSNIEDKPLPSLENIIHSNQSHNKNFFTSRENHVKVLWGICNSKINEICNHHFVEDTIDISPDKSINIQYCTICEYTVQPN